MELARFIVRIPTEWSMEGDQSFHVEQSSELHGYSGSVDGR